MDQALCLRRFPYGESSLVLHVVTPEHGRVALLAKGAYRASSGFCGVFDLFDTLEVRWSAPAGQDLGLVAKAALCTRRTAITGDLERYRVALALLELAGMAAREAHEERSLFHWLEGALDLLDGAHAAPGVVAVATELGFLRSCGLAPALELCASCGARPERATAIDFSAALGGRLCARCSAEARLRGQAITSLPLNVVRVAASLVEATPGVLEHTRIEDGLLRRVREFVERFLEYHLETRPRSLNRAPPRTRSSRP